MFSFSLSQATIVYLSVVGGVGLVGMFVLRIWFRRSEQRHQEHVEGLRRFVAIKQSPAEPNATGKARERALESNETRFAMMRRVTFPFYLCVWLLLLGLPFLNRVPATLVSLLITALTVILGIAAKPVLENAIAGMVLSFSQPMRIGDLVLIGGKHYGIVEEINLTHTLVKLWDWRRYVIPNHRLLQSEYINYTIIDRWQWAYVPFWVSYDSDLDLVRRLAVEAVDSCPSKVRDTTAGFWIIEMKPQGLVCWIAGWVDHPLDAWSLRHSVARELVTRFREHGICSHVYNYRGADQAPPSEVVPPIPPMAGPSEDPGMPPPPGPALEGPQGIEPGGPGRAWL